MICVISRWTNFHGFGSVICSAIATLYQCWMSLGIYLSMLWCGIHAIGIGFSTDLFLDVRTKSSTLWQMFASSKKTS